MSLYQVVVAKRYQCNQNAVIGSQSTCRHIENVLTVTVLTKGGYCSLLVDEKQFTCEDTLRYKHQIVVLHLALPEPL